MGKMLHPTYLIFIALPGCIIVYLLASIAEICLGCALIVDCFIIIGTSYNPFELSVSASEDSLSWWGQL